MLAHDSAHPICSNHQLEGERPHRSNAEGFAEVCGTTAREAYLQGLVVPAVGPVRLAASAVQHEQGPVAVPGLQTAGLVQTHHTQAGLHQGQRILVGLIWIADAFVSPKNVVLKDGM